VTDTGTPDLAVDADDEDANAVPAATAQAVLEYLVRAVVDDPEAVRVNASHQRGRIRLDVQVGQGDMGRVIGKRGRIAQSIRTVVRAAAVRDDVEVDVEFID
jgi:predicted RNA-binding protein YlqC (UPF0109 family)